MRIDDGIWAHSRVIQEPLDVVGGSLSDNALYRALVCRLTPSGTDMGAGMALAGRLWLHYEETTASVPSEERDTVRRKVMAMRTRQKWVGISLLLGALLLASTGPGQAWRGGHGFRGHGFHHGFRGHGFHHGFRGHGFHHGFRGHGFHHGFRGHGFHHGSHHGFRGPRIGIGIGIGPFWGW
jgi:hypothetical protein